MYETLVLSTDSGIVAHTREKSLLKRNIWPQGSSVFPQFSITNIISKLEKRAVIVIIAACLARLGAKRKFYRRNSCHERETGKDRTRIEWSETVALEED